MYCRRRNLLKRRFFLAIELMLLARFSFAIQITEVMYHPKTFENRAEWIEIHNETLADRDIGGWAFAEGIDFFFPEGTTLKAGQYLVIARDPAYVQTVYGISGVMGPFTGRLANGSDHVILFGKGGGIMAEVDYEDRGKWPVAADGAGHSLAKVLTRHDPMDPDNWAASLALGGTPGAANGFNLQKPEPSVVINEVHFNTLGLQFIELHNQTASPINLSGYQLSNKLNQLDLFSIPTTATLPANGFLSFSSADMGFLMDPLGDPVLLSATAPTRVIDARRVEPGPFDWSEGRWPDGGDKWRYSTPTLTAANLYASAPQIVINEIMYSPPSDDDLDEYIELYNASAQTVSLNGWSLTRGVDYDFPSTATIAAGAYLVVAKDRDRLISRYGLAPETVWGNFSGKLSNDGEKIRLRDLNGNPADEVRYYDGGNWPKYADGYGSSLELIDSRHDNNNYLAWSASDETAKAQWTHFEYSGIISPPTDINEHELHIVLMGPGNALIDNLSLKIGATEYMLDGGFENNDGNDWVIMGSHRDSGVTDKDAFEGTHSLEILAISAGDTAGNHLEYNMSSALISGQEATLSFQAKWRYGNPNLITMLWGNDLPMTHRLPRPDLTGTPGAPNSIHQANIGPIFYDTTHTPLLPKSPDSVIVRTRIYDPDGVATASVLYQGDFSASPTTLTLHDDGVAPDDAAGDGVYAAEIPPHANDQTVAFYFTADDGLGAANRWPAQTKGPALYRVEDTDWNPKFPKYRIIMTAKDKDDLYITPPKMSNYLRNCTFIYDDREVYYTCGVRLIGSSFHRRDNRNPAYTGNKIKFNDDDMLHGVKGQSRFDFLTNSGYKDRLTYHLLSKMAQPYSQTEWINVRINEMFTGMNEEIIPPGKQYLQTFYPGDDDGTLMELYPIYNVTTDDDTYLAQYINEKSLMTYLGPEKEAYRWFYRLRNHDIEDDYSPLIPALEILTKVPATATMEELSAHWDIRQCLSMIAIRTVNSNTDFDGRKNGYIYHVPSTSKWQMLAWDCESGFNTKHVNLNLWTSLTPQIRLFLQYKGNAHLYMNIIHEYLAKYFNHTYLDPWINHYYSVSGGLNPNTAKKFVTDRRAYILGQLAGYSLPNLTSRVYNPQPLPITPTTTTLTGQAPINTSYLRIDGQDHYLEWTSSINWTLAIPTPQNTDSVKLEFLDYDKQPVQTLDILMDVPDPPPPPPPPPPPVPSTSKTRNWLLYEEPPRP